MSTDTNTEEPVVLRAEDGVWYALPTSEFERARVTDPRELAELRGHLDATQDRASATLLSADVLEAHRLSDQQAAELETAVAADTRGFDFKVGDIYWWGNHNTAYGAVTTSVEGGTVTMRAAYVVPLNLVAQRNIIWRSPGYGR